MGQTQQDTEQASLYAAFLQVIRLHYCRTHALLDRVGVYPGQPPLLFALSRKDGVSQKELAKRLHVKPATITIMLKRMQKAGLVVRKQDPRDQRVMLVYLTADGRRVLRQVEDVMKVVNSECFGGFTTEEQTVLHGLLTRMRENLSAACGLDS